MKISTLIKRLEAAREKYGDLPVKKYDSELEYSPVEYLAIDGIDNVWPRWPKKRVADTNKQRKADGLLPLNPEAVKTLTAPRPIHKPKYVWF